MCGLYDYISHAGAIPGPGAQQVHLQESTGGRGTPIPDKAYVMPVGTFPSRPDPENHPSGDPELPVSSRVRFLHDPNQKTIHLERPDSSIRVLHDFQKNMHLEVWSSKIPLGAVSFTWP